MPSEQPDDLRDGEQPADVRMCSKHDAEILHAPGNSGPTAQAPCAARVGMRVGALTSCRQPQDCAARVGMIRLMMKSLLPA
jgi:hypothetical protein